MHSVNHYFFFTCSQVKINQTENQKGTGEQISFRECLCKVSKGVVYISSDEYMITIYYPNDYYLLFTECGKLLATSVVSDLTIYKTSTGGNRFVQLVRSKSLKNTSIFTRHGKCVLMKNYPSVDFEV